MRRMVSDGIDLYELFVDDEGESLGEASRGRPAEAGRVAVPVSFEDPAVAFTWLQRVADDYSEKLVLRQVLAARSGRDDLHRLSEDELNRALAAMLVSGALAVNRLERRTG